MRCVHTFVISDANKYWAINSNDSGLNGLSLLWLIAPVLKCTMGSHGS